MEQTEILIRSTLDNSLQPSLFYRASKPGRPLLVGLHTWSFDRFNQIQNMLPLAEKHGFHLLLPDFRGKNRIDNPHLKEAMGSECAKGDIKDAIDFVTERFDVDRDNIFLLGASGGGHMALLMAGYCPEYFKAVGAFVPITDLSLWVDENRKYAKHIVACCGEDREEMRRRSPVFYMENIARANVKLFHGRRDPVVPVTQSIQFFLGMREAYPDASIYLDVFDGGHQMDQELAEHWILSQYKKEKKVEVTG